MRLSVVSAVAACFVAACASPGGEPDGVGGAVPETLPQPATTSTLMPVSTEAASVLPDLGPLPELEDLDGWLQTDMESLDELRGKVVVVQFWTFGCHNCKATLPNLQSLYAEHAGDDFEIVGIHSPEFEYEEDPDAVAAAAEDLGVTWPIALDTRQRNFFAWQGSPAYWPRTYVVDRDGNVRFDHIGEGAYSDLNEAVATLLG